MYNKKYRERPSTYYLSGAGRRRAIYSAKEQVYASVEYDSALFLLHRKVLQTN